MGVEGVRVQRGSSPSDAPHERDVVPLHPDLVPLVREWISQLHHGDPLFYLLEQRKTATMLQADLEAAGIPYQAANGLYADFHSLPHSFIAGAWESGETPEVVMALAAHRSLAMTMRYAPVDRSAQVRAVKAMRSPSEKGWPALGVGQHSVLSHACRLWSRRAFDPGKKSTPDRIRTCNPRFRRPMRYPIAPRAQSVT